MQNQLKDNLYDLLTDYIDDPEKVSEVYDKIEELESDIKDYHKSEVKHIKGQVTSLQTHIVSLQEHIAVLNTDITLLKNNISELEDKLEYEEKQNKLLKNAIRHFSLFRAALNKIVHEYWNKYKDELDSIDYDTLPYLSRKKLDNNGFKYALARINGYGSELSKELCQLYLDLNDSFHPKLKPIKIVKDSIHTMKELIKTNNIPDYYKNIGLNEDIMNEFETVIQTNGHLLN